MARTVVVLTAVLEITAVVDLLAIQLASTNVGMHDGVGAFPTLNAPGNNPSGYSLRNATARKVRMPNASTLSRVVVVNS